MAGPCALELSGELGRWRSNYSSGRQVLTEVSVAEVKSEKGRTSACGNLEDFLAEETLRLGLGEGNMV